MVGPCGGDCRRYEGKDVLGREGSPHFGCADYGPVKSCLARVNKRRSRDASMSDDSHELIRLAFEKAKGTGRPNWYCMDVGVLKNRILELTDRRFRESDYGVPTFMEFVRGHSDILQLDETRRPPGVTLKGMHVQSESAREPARTKVRSDLWRAVMDFAGDARYVWDKDEGVAKPERDCATDAPAIPTVTVEQFTGWKRAFARNVDDAEQDDRFNDWVENLRPATFLAGPVRHRWNEHLKKEVENHLSAWFGQQKLPVPPDLLESLQGARRNSDDELRRRLIACVRSMTPDELERVQIPSSALLRVKL